MPQIQEESNGQQQEQFNGEQEQEQGNPRLDFGPDPQIGPGGPGGPTQDGNFQAGCPLLATPQGKVPTHLKNLWKHGNNEVSNNKYIGKRIPASANTTFIPQGNYDIQTVYELMKKSEKNPIQLLHEYCSRVKKNVTYQFDVRDFTSRPKKEHYVCSITIDNFGVIARGDAASKRDAKNLAGEKALSSLISSDDKARAIIGGL